MIRIFRYSWLFWAKYTFTLWRSWLLATLIFPFIIWLIWIKTQIIRDPASWISSIFGIAKPWLENWQIDRFRWLIMEAGNLRTVIGPFTTYLFFCFANEVHHMDSLAWRNLSFLALLIIIGRWLAFGALPAETFVDLRNDSFKVLTAEGIFFVWWIVSLECLRFRFSLILIFNNNSRLMIWYPFIIVIVI